MNELTRQLLRLQASVLRRTTTRMILGDGQGNLIVYDDAGDPVPDYYWARPQSSDETSASVRQIRVIKTAARYGLPVLVRAGADGELEAVEPDPLTAPAFGSGDPGAVPNHNRSHQLQAHDPIFIRGEQVLPGLPHPTTPPSLSITVRPFHYVRAGAWALWSGADLDLTSYLPTGSNEHRLIVVSFVPATGALAVTAATAVVPIVPGTETMIFTDADIQAVAVPAGYWRLAAIRLVVGQTEVRWRDWVADLRLPFGGVESAPVDDSARYIAWEW